MSRPARVVLAAWLALAWLLGGCATAGSPSAARDPLEPMNRAVFQFNDAVDRAVALMRAAGLKDFSVQAGGDLYVAGRRGDRPWRLGIADPRAPDGAVFARVELEDSTFSTSGDYERAFVKDGVRYHHILDPRTGQPSRVSRSVTIVAKDALIADGLSTGVFLLGPEAGMALIERLPDVEGVIVGADNKVLVSSGLKDKLEIVHPPTDGI